MFWHSRGFLTPSPAAAKWPLVNILFPLSAVPGRGSSAREGASCSAPEPSSEPSAPPGSLSRPQWAVDEGPGCGCVEAGGEERTGRGCREWWDLELMGLVPPCLATVPLQGDPPAGHRGCESPGNRDSRAASPCGLLNPSEQREHPGTRGTCLGTAP